MELRNRYSVVVKTTGLALVWLSTPKCVKAQFFAFRTTLYCRLQSKNDKPALIVPCESSTEEVYYNRHTKVFRPQPPELQLPIKWIVPCENTAEVVSFEWSISFRDSKGCNSLHYLKKKNVKSTLLRRTPPRRADWVSVLHVKKDSTDSVKLCFGWWDLRNTLLWWKFRILFHRKAVRPKTKASSSALIRDCRQWVRKSCLHLQVHSPQALWAQVVTCQSPLWRQTCLQIRWSFFDLLVRSVLFYSRLTTLLDWLMDWLTDW